MAGVERSVRLPDIEALVLALHGSPRALTPSEEDVLSAAAERVVEFIQNEWPVDTGTSSDGWHAVTSVSPGEYGFTLINDIDYAEWVHPAGTPAVPEGWYWQQLTATAWASERAGLIADLTSEVVRTEGVIRALGGGRTNTLRVQAGRVKLSRVAA